VEWVGGDEIDRKIVTFTIAEKFRDPHRLPIERFDIGRRWRETLGCGGILGESRMKIARCRTAHAQLPVDSLDCLCRAVLNFGAPAAWLYTAVSWSESAY
jgi:hypothetical protein